MTIRLTNTLTRKVEEFSPIDPTNVRMYVCGPTVYDRAHLGNARPVVVFDTLFRLLRHTYGPDHVTYVRNFTDVDDKINAKAAETGRTIGEITEETISWYHADMDALGTLRPTHEPRATAYIAQMVAMIEGLIGSGHAYAVEGHVLFRVRSYKDYGRLSGRSVDDMIAGARVEVAPFKEDPMDFVLWKPSSNGEPAWDGPKDKGVEVSKGRPGWHIECSAMADEILMKGLPEDKKAFDIHAGGLDLQFPHHENEIAQSCCAHPSGGFARVWLHNEMLQVEGKKMSKSLGNFFTVRDLLDQGIPGEVIRLVLLQTHYRRPMDWTEEKKNIALGHLRKWAWLKTKRLSDQSRKFSGRGVDQAVVDALSNDLNTHEALTVVFKMASQVELDEFAQLDSPFTLRFFETLAFLGFEKLDPEGPGRRSAVSQAIHAVLDEPAVRKLILDLQQRLASLHKAAMESKEFSAVDALKSALQAAGVEVRMSKAGVELVPGRDFDPSKLEAL